MSFAFARLRIARPLRYNPAKFDFSASAYTLKMGKNKKSSVPDEGFLLLPARVDASATPIVDTHTHISSTFDAYRAKYKHGKYKTVFDFIRGMCEGRSVDAIIDVWCEAPVQRHWKEFADSALTEEDRLQLWGGTEYWFVMGVHPHQAKFYTNEVENHILEAMAHARCVGWGEIGLDYHYDNSPRDIQQEVLIRQIKHAVKLGKPITIHTREAEEDTERILKEHVPKDHRIHVHCFTDSQKFAETLLDYFPNLHIGITGVITYSSNKDTSNAVRYMVSTQPDLLRILLETDGPYMVPANIYGSLAAMKGKLPICHTGMIPWTAEFVAGVAGGEWTAESILKVARDNARKVYGV